MKLYYNPVSSYSMKAVMAFHEKGVAFTPAIVNLMDPGARAEYAKVYPVGKVPFLDTEGKDGAFPESTIIVEYLEQKHPGGTKLIPDDPELAREVRLLDRLFDLGINDPMQKIFFDGMRPPGKNDPFGVEQAKQRLDASYAILDARLAGKTWAAGDAFSMADCAAAPALFYAKNVHPFAAHANLSKYAARVLERPSFQACVKEAAPILAAMRG